MDIRHILSPLKGRNTQVLMKNFSSLAILQVLRYLIPLIVLPYVTPIIGLEHFGDIAISASFTLIVQVFVSYSFSFMGARDIARNLGDMGVISRIVSNTLTAYVFTYLLILPFAACIIYLIPKFRSIWLLMAINLLSPLFSAFVCEWFFQGIEQMQNITIVNAISRIVFIILVFTFIKNESDYLLYPLFEVIGFVIASIYSICLIFFKFKCKFRIPSPHVLFCHYKQGKDIFINQAVLRLFNKMPNIILGNISGASSAGLYHAAFRIQEAGYHGVDALNRTFFPFLARRMDKHNAYRKINAVFAIIISLLLFICAPLFIRLLYAPQFAPAVPILRILSLSVLFLGFSSAYGVNHLLLLGKEVLVRNITICISCVGILLLFIMIRRYSSIGAAVSMVTINASMALSYFIAAKIVSVHSNIKNGTIEK